MTQNEVVQWSVVGIIVLMALIWAAIRIYNLSRHKGADSGCSCCSSAPNCKAKELKHSGAHSSYQRSQGCGNSNHIVHKKTKNR